MANIARLVDATGGKLDQTGRREAGLWQRGVLFTGLRAIRRNVSPSLVESPEKCLPVILNRMAIPGQAETHRGSHWKQNKALRSKPEK
jgi:hypothetical protein